MADRAQFQKKLGELLAVAASQNNKMTSQEVQAFFQDDNLTDEQMNLVHEFLMSQKVEVIGYTGTIENTEKTEQEEKDTLSHNSSLSHLLQSSHHGIKYCSPLHLRSHNRLLP